MPPWKSTSSHHLPQIFKSSSSKFQSLDSNLSFPAVRGGVCEHRVHLFVSRRPGEKMTENIRMTQVQWVLGILLCSGVSLFKMETIQLAKADFPRISSCLIGENGSQKETTSTFNMKYIAIPPIRMVHVQEPSPI